jgi:hypothetical protein
VRIPSARVLLVCEARDPHGVAVHEEMDRRGIRAVRCCVADLRTMAFVGEPAASRVDDRPLDDPITVWWRRSGQLPVGDLEDSEAQLHAAEAWTLFTGALLAADPRWVDDPFAGYRAMHKPHQLVRARAAGIAVPDTIITNDRAVAADFLDQGPCIAKSASSGPGAAPFTEAIRRADLPYVSEAPVLLQRRVDAVADVRLVVAGDSVHVWRRDRAPDELDWRDPDPKGQMFRPISSDGWHTAIQLTRDLGLTCSIQDWLLDQDGRPVFLEANIEGHWLFLRDAERRVTPALVDHLVADV